MKITILLHSTTGNTKVVTHYAAAVLEAEGHSCAVVDIVKHPDPPALEGVDLLGVACPTLYFRPPFAMERYLARLPVAPHGPTPAFLFGTCMGAPGAQFALIAEQLLHKQFIALCTHWVLAPSNWPTHIHAMRKLETTTPIGTWLNTLSRPLRPLWGSIWPYCVVPDELDRRAFDAFLLRALRLAGEGRLDQAPTPNELHHDLPTTNTQGRIFPRYALDSLGFSADPSRCSRCGTCLSVCPVDVVRRDGDDELPRFLTGCTGCFACFNHCPDGAISCLGTPAGAGRYHGPPRRMRELFRPRRARREG